MFGALAQVVQLDAPPAGDAARDAAAVLERARGRPVVFGRARPRRSPAMFEFFAEQDGRRVPMGGELRVRTSARSSTSGVPDAPRRRLAFVGGGEVLAFGRGHLVMQRPVTAPAYRVEVYIPGRPRAVDRVESRSSRSVRARARSSAAAALLDDPGAADVRAAGRLSRSPPARVTVTPRGAGDAAWTSRSGPARPPASTAQSSRRGRRTGPFDRVELTVRADRHDCGCLGAASSAQAGADALATVGLRRHDARDVQPSPLAEFDRDRPRRRRSTRPAGLRLLLVVDTVNTTPGTTARSTCRSALRAVKARTSAELKASFAVLEICSPVSAHVRP